MNTLEKSKFPVEASPMLATLVDKPFDDDDWVFEIKWDGYRTLAFIEKGKVNLLSRNKKSFNLKFSEITSALAEIPFDVILDGEVVAVDEKGKPSFQLLQNYEENEKDNLIYYVFDILYLGGHDLTNLPLLERKKLLKRILKEGPSIRYSDFIKKHGKELFRIAMENSLEGIIAKNATSKYLPGKRTLSWLKIKGKKRQEAIICGYTEGFGSRKFFGALILGIYENNKLIYIGHTGGGFDEASLNSLFKKISSLKDLPHPLEKFQKPMRP